MRQIQLVFLLCHHLFLIGLLTMVTYRHRAETAAPPLTSQLGHRYYEGQIYILARLSVEAVEQRGSGCLGINRIIVPPLKVYKFQSIFITTL